MTEEGWDEKDRRHGEMAQVRAELKSVRTALMKTAESLATMAPREDVDAALENERRERRRYTGMITTFIIVLTLFLTATAFQIHQTANLAKANRVNIAKGNEYGFNAVGCIIYRLYEHRNANEFAHRGIVTNQGKKYDEPAELMPPPIETIAKFKNTCDKFFATTPPTTVTIKK